MTATDHAGNPKQAAVRLDKWPRPTACLNNLTVNKNVLNLAGSGHSERCDTIASPETADDQPAANPDGIEERFETLVTGHRSLTWKAAVARPQHARIKR